MPVSYTHLDVYKRQALYNYMAQMIVELIKLASLIITLNKSAACAGRVADILKVK